MTTFASPQTHYESQMPREDPLKQSAFKVVRRLVDRSGKTMQISTPLQNVTRAEAVDLIKAQQAEFERRGTNKEFDYAWAANPSAPGCSAENVTRWTIER
jgi:hypothetical protein